MGDAEQRITVIGTWQTFGRMMLAGEMEHG